jgi:S-DNA-T family DNA segregation ATPase FtsK/SpoIIIE
VLLLALCVLAFFAVATFDARDRLGPGFHNAIGPVGHALAEMLRGFFGVGAFVLPVMVGYLATLMMTEDRSKRRWPQVLCVALLLVCGSVLAQLIFGAERGWAHAPGGLLGKSVGGAMTALFSTVGTVVLVSALASVALMVGTQFYFLKFVHWALEGLKVLFEKVKVWGLAFIAAQKERLAERALKAEEDARAEEEFLAELDEQDAELQRMELEAEEAEQAAEATARHQRETEETRLQRLAQKEAERQIREQERQQREVERLARQMLKETRAEAKARAMVPAAITEPPVPAAALANAVPASAPLLPEPAPGHDPAWAMTLPSPARAAEVTEPPPPARQPRIANLPEIKAVEVTPPPVPFDACLPPAPAEKVEAAVVAPTHPSTALGTPLARTPVIVEPKSPPKPTAAAKKTEQFEFVGDRKYFAAPPIDILEMNKKERNQLDKEAFLTTAEKLRAKLADFGIVGEVVEIRPGPVVTMYEFLPGPGIKVSKIAALADDLAMAMEAMRVRIVAPIPGKGVVGIEVPNRDRETVFLKEVAEQDAFQKSGSRLTMCLGKDIEGMPYVFDLAKAPHLLIAGTTGSGKSVAVNSMIMSILLKSTPEEVRFLMVDP